MPACPQCGRSYGDEMRFCLNDGTPLSGAASANFETPTEEFTVGDTRAAGPGNTLGQRHSVATLTSSRAKRSGVVPLLVGVLVLIVGLGLIGLAAAGGVWYFMNTGSDPAGNEVAETGETDPITRMPTATPTPAAEPSIAFPTGSPTGTRSPKDDDPANKVVTDPRSVSVTTPREEQLADGPANRAPDVRPTDSRPARMPKMVSGGVLNGRATFLPKPPYPPAARAVRASGSVSVHVTVSESGDVISANAVSGHPLLRAAAARAARNARFSPMILSGQPVKVTGVIVYNFVP